MHLSAVQRVILRVIGGINVRQVIMLMRIKKIRSKIDRDVLV